MTTPETASNESLFDVEQLGKEMLDAVRAALAVRGPALRQMGEAEIRRLAAVLADIAGLLARGEIDRKGAKAMATIHQFTVSSVLRSVEGLGVLATRDVLKAAARVAGAVVNRIIGFKLL